MNRVIPTNIDYTAALNEFLFLLACGVVGLVALIFVIAGLIEWWEIVKECLAGKNIDSH